MDRLLRLSCRREEHPTRLRVRDPLSREDVALPVEDADGADARSRLLVALRNSVEEEARVDRLRDVRERDRRRGAVLVLDPNGPRGGREDVASDLRRVLRRLVRRPREAHRRARPRQAERPARTCRPAAAESPGERLAEPALARRRHVQDVRLAERPEDTDPPGLRGDRLGRHAGRCIQREVEELPPHLERRRLPVREPYVRPPDEVKEELPDAERGRREEGSEGGGGEREHEHLAPRQELPPTVVDAWRLALRGRPDHDPRPTEDVVPVPERARVGRDELADRAEEDGIAHCRSSGIASRSAACALCSVAETVPRATPSTSAISS